MAESNMYPRKAGRSTSLALKQAQAAMDAAKKGIVYGIHDHLNTIEAHKTQTKLVSAVLRALGVDHHIIGNNSIKVLPLLTEEEMEFGPLPNWARGYNKNHSLLEGAQLFTKNGRKIGNAFITCVVSDKEYCLITESGNLCRFTFEDIDDLFTVGDFIADADEIAKRFLR